MGIKSSSLKGIRSGEGAFESGQRKKFELVNGHNTARVGTFR